MITHSIIQKSQLQGAQRIDAEYYALSGLKTNFMFGKDILSFVQYGTSEELNEEKKGFPILRLNEIKDSFINEPAKWSDRINNRTFKELELHKGDVLVCRTNGNPKLVGKSAIVLSDPKIAFASYLFRIRPKANLINASSLVVFLNSKFGREEIEKHLKPSNQSNFSPATFREIKIPILSHNIQKYLEDTLLSAYEQSNNSKTFYQQAEEVLLKELGLKNFQVEGDLSFVVNLSDVESAGRIDAEYFQPKYEQLISNIKNRNAKLLDNLVSMKKGFEPGSEAYQEEGKLFIRVSSLSKFGVDSTGQKYVSNELYNKMKDDFEPKAGEILLTKDATPGIAYVLKESVEGIISGGILRMKIKQDIEPEYLALCINSLVGQMQAKRDAGGSIIAHWKSEQIKNILIPVLPKESQQKIAELVKKSHETRKKSKELLEEAKRRVEEYIEKGGGENEKRSISN